jgi:AcrR family transcriptional regulator
VTPTVSSTDEEIMEATYRVLADSSYSALSIRRIAEEFEGSQSLIYYHYEDKEDLLAGFLAYLLDQFEREFAAIETDDPAERLTALVELVVPRRDEAERLAFQQTLEEIRTQTPYHEEYRELFEEFDARFEAELRSTIQRGLDDGTFAGVDAADGADKLILLLVGITGRHVPMRDWDGIERGQTVVEREIDSWRRS